jgi:hypothetical protein
MFHNAPFGEKVGSSHVATGTIGLNLRPLSGLPGPALLTGRAVFSGAVDPNARPAHHSLITRVRVRFFVKLERSMAREELKWQNIDADDLPAEVKKSFDAMVEAEAAFKADLEKLLKNEGHMPEDKFLVMSRKGKRLGVAFASTPRGEGGAGSLKFKTK